MLVFRQQREVRPSKAIMFMTVPATIISPTSINADKAYFDTQFVHHCSVGIAAFHILHTFPYKHVSLHRDGRNIEQVSLPVSSFVLIKISRSEARHHQ